MRESGTEAATAQAATADQLASSAVTYVEARSALARMRAARRLTIAEHRRQLAAFGELWLDAAVIPAEDGVLRAAARLAERHVLRAYGAVQLASALEVRAGEDVTFACWDRELRSAAAGERLPLGPERL